MKTQKGATLTQVLASLSAQGKKYGDVLFTTLKEAQGKMKLTFSNIPDSFILGWDKGIKRWVVQ